MSTEHVLIQKKGNPVLSVLESSSKFTLELAESPDSMRLPLAQLSAQDLVKIARNLIQIASYNVEDGEELLQRFNMDYATESLVIR